MHGQDSIGGLPVKLAFSNKSMDIGTFEFNFMRTLMVAGTGGAEISDCFLVADRIKQNDAESWVREWALMAERVRQSAISASQLGQQVTARHAFLRASNYYRTAMFSLPHTDARLDRYLTASRDCFHEAAKLAGSSVEVVEIPFGGARLPAYFISAALPGPRPTLLVLNGGDSTNEELVHWLGFAASARGWNCIVFEGPGQWSALQMNPGLFLRADYEAPVRVVIDYLVARADVDSGKIALFGPSLGALLAARVVAFEGRIKACVCDGLVVDVYEAWHAVWPLMLQKAPPIIFDGVFGLLEILSPQLRGMANHFRWMLGVSKPHEIIDAWKPFRVSDLAPRIQCPMLVLYGEAEAAESDERVMLSALRFISELRSPVSIHLFGFEDGWAASHCQIGSLAPMQALVFDWLDKAVHCSEHLPRCNIGENVGPVLSRYMKQGAPRSACVKLLESIQLG
jgi:pimeloyl-ACP methyl ester carboxylesterase